MTRYNDAAFRHAASIASSLSRGVDLRAPTHKTRAAFANRMVHRAFALRRLLISRTGHNSPVVAELTHMLERQISGNWLTKRFEAVTERADSAVLSTTLRSSLAYADRWWTELHHSASSPSRLLPQGYDHARAQSMWRRMRSTMQNLKRDDWEIIVMLVIAAAAYAANALIGNDHYTMGTSVPNLIPDSFTISIG